MAAAPPADPRLISVIALGGGLGSLARYGVGELWAVGPGHVPWSTLMINVTGSLLLGMLVVAVTEVWSANRLVRPALGTGVLGGYTTFSTFAVQLRGLPIGVGALYLALSLVAGIAAAALGMAFVRRFATRTAQELLDPDLP